MAAPIPESSIKIGLRIEATDKRLPGKIQYVGQTQFAAGKWIGVALDVPMGKNDGTVQGKRYFQCSANHGLFIRANQVFPAASVKDDELSDVISDSASMTGSTASASGQKRPTGLRAPSSVSKPKPGAGRESTGGASGLKKPSSTTRLSMPASGRGGSGMKGSPSSDRLSASQSSERLSSGPPSKASSAEKLTRSGGTPSSGKPSPSPSVEQLAAAGAGRGKIASPPGPRPSGAPLQPKEQKPAPTAPAAVEKPLAQPAAEKPPSQPAAEEAREAQRTALKDMPRAKRMSVAEQVAQKEEDVKRVREEAAGVIRSSVSSHYGSTFLEGADAGTELEFLRSECKDLNEKLETLRTKRQEDKQKLIDYEKCKIQLQQLLEYKVKMTEQHTQLQRDLQQAIKDAKEAVDSKEVDSDELTDLREALELATLDKEMAEEKAEMLQQELDATKEKVEELTIDLEILKDEAERGRELAPSQPGESLSVRQLEAQNERLKEALIKLRDLTEHEKRENQRLAREVEEMRTQLNELVRKNERLTFENGHLETTSNELKEQVDAALGAEEMVEQLTQKNLTLEEKMQSLEETISDLEQLREMDEELQENAKETERELQEELDMAHSKINESRVQMEAKVSVIQDLEMTIRKFRKHTSQMQEEIQDLKDRLAISEAKQSGELQSDDSMDNEGNRKKSLTDNSPTLSSLTLVAGGIRQTKMLAEIVDSLVRKVDLDNALQHVRYLRAFLPDNFGRPAGDADCVLLNLLIPRIISKLELLMYQVKDKFPIPPGGMSRDHVMKSHKGDQWSFVNKMSYYGHSLVALLAKYNSILSRCSVERLLKLAQLQPEMSAQERHIDHYFELIKTNRLDENTPLEQLEKAANYFQNLYTVHLLSEDYDQTEYMANCCRQLLHGFTWISTDLKRIRHYLVPESESTELWTFLDEFQLYLSESESCVRKIRGRIPQDGQTILRYEQEVPEMIAEAASHVQRAAMILNIACAGASNQVTLIPDAEGVEVERMGELLQEAAEKVCGRLQDKSLQDVLNIFRLSLGVVMANTGKLADSMEKGSYDSAAAQEKKSQFPPLLERAHSRKQEAVEADGLRWQLDKKDAEIMDLKKALRLKAEEVSEMMVRKELAEKRLTTSGKEGDEKVVSLQKKLDEHHQEYKKKEREYEQTMDTLQGDIELLEKENNDLKERMKMLCKKTLLQNISKDIGLLPGGQAGSPTTPTTPGQTQQDIYERFAAHAAADAGAHGGQLEALRMALEISEAKRHKLMSQRMHNMLRDLPPINVPRKPTGLESQTGLFDLEKHTLQRRQPSEVKDLVREVNRLQKDLLTFTRGNKVVNIVKPKQQVEPVLEKSKPAFQLQLKELEIQRLNQWMDDVRVKAKRVQAQGLDPSGDDDQGSQAGGGLLGKAGAKLSSFFGGRKIEDARSDPDTGDTRICIARVRLRGAQEAASQPERTVQIPLRSYSQLKRLQEILIV